MNEKYYCYLDDAMGIDTSELFVYHTCDCKNCYFRDTINGECYKDPDAHSRQLYEDMAEVYNFRAKELGLNFKVEKGFNPYYKTPCLFIIENDVTSNDSFWYSSDYIGPARSTSGAKSPKVNASEEEIGEVLRICRTIGGHMFWPGYQIQRQNTINQARGGKPLFDRIDYTLAELKNYLCGKDCKYYDNLYAAFGRYEEWFRHFGEIGSRETFVKFIKFFFLEGFLNEKDEVIDLSREKTAIINSNCKPFDKESYKNYSENSKQIIGKRTEDIVDYARTNALKILDIKYDG